MRWGVFGSTKKFFGLRMSSSTPTPILHRLYFFAVTLRGYSIEAACSRSIDFHSPLMMAARICAGVLPALVCW
jgi:hypothetical protein